MEHIAALILIIGCSDDLTQCRELPAPTPIYETKQDCDAALPDFLEGCEVLIDMLPLTPATENLLRRDTLARLPRGATVVNLARGRHVVEDDLLALLDAGHLGAAVLDVFRAEPLATDHPLWTHPRVVVTPHVAALSLPDGCAAQVAEKIRCIEASGPVTGEVDLGAGY